MAVGRTAEFELKVNQQTMAKIHADMARYIKMAPMNTMMCELHVVHPHRGIVMLTCTPG